MNDVCRNTLFVMPFGNQGIRLCVKIFFDVQMESRMRFGQEL